MHFENIHSGLYSFACSGEKQYPVRNTPHLACVHFIDHITVTVLTAHCMTVCVSAIISPGSAPPHTNTLFRLLVGVSFKPDMLHVNKCRPSLASYRMNSILA